MLLQPDDSLQILAPVEADVGFYACNASNALGSDSVSIAVTLAGNNSLILTHWSLPLVWFWTEIVCWETDGSGRWVGKVNWQSYIVVKTKPWVTIQHSQTVHEICAPTRDRCFFSLAKSEVHSQDSVLIPIRAYPLYSQLWAVHSEMSNLYALF